MKDKIFKFLDEKYPIDKLKDNLIDLSFNENIDTIIEKVFGITDINFSNWRDERCGNIFGYQTANGTKTWYKIWYKKVRKHRDNDKPAIILSDGTKYWYQNGKYHRNNDKPAIISPNGTKFWCQNGKYHRDNDKPAIISANGDKYWYINGKFIKILK